MKTRILKPEIQKILPVTICILLTGFLLSCTNDNEEEDSTDKDLYEMAKQTAGFQWYNNSDALDAGSNDLGSQHNLPYFRTRFNSEAATKLDADGRVLEDASFPEGSLIVKELYDENEALALYAIRLKTAGHDDADDKGWVWGYVHADGSVEKPAADKGNACITCHSQAGNIDYVLLNKVTR